MKYIELVPILKDLSNTSFYSDRARNIKSYFSYVRRFSRVANSNIRVNLFYNSLWLFNREIEVEGELDLGIFNNKLIKIILAYNFTRDENDHISFVYGQSNLEIAYIYKRFKSNNNTKYNILVIPNEYEIFNIVERNNTNALVNALRFMHTDIIHGVPNHVT